MSNANNGYHDSEDIFKHTRMSLGDHIEELRRHMIKALLGFGVMMIIGLYYGEDLMKWIAQPVINELNDMRLRRLQKIQQELREKIAAGASQPMYVHQTIFLPNCKAAHELGARELTEAEKKNPPRLKDLRNLPLTAKELEERRPKTVTERATDMVMGKPKGEQPAEGDEPADVLALDILVNGNESAVASATGQNLVEPIGLSSLTVTETFMVWMKVGVYFGIVLSSPWIFYQMWMFVAAGMYPHEKKYVHIYLPFSLFLFLCGVALCEYVVMPIGLHYLLSFNESMNVEPNLRLTDWLSFAIMMPLIFGIAFQTPLVMFFLERIGLVDASFYRKHRRAAIFVLALAAALLAVSPDPLSMMAMAIPMWCLYELGIKLCEWMPREKYDMDVPESEELIEV
jgi:sec-independent protein translocase protein TatC